ncbi:MAG: hypothetical protein A2Y25_05965 [Candidatus Melainabacteria bacterium GWF2_37_15]|nr:MAG: hypothetical protein A2Y25_05965 [Candidatus Melainabacteria bacterium GWF2_37_15]
MSIGAKDHIDKMLVKKYAKERMNNASEAEVLMRSPETYWRYAKEMAEVQWAIVKATSYLKKKKDEATQQFLNSARPAVS